MNESVIKNWFKHDKNFLGVYPGDLHCLPNITAYPSALISNTDPHDESGEHWIAIYFTRKGDAEYFDSYGNEPMIQSHINFMNNNAINILHNTKRVQGLVSMTCGGHCIYFLKLKFKGFSMKQIQKIYNSNNDINDAFIYLTFHKRDKRIIKK